MSLSPPLYHPDLKKKLVEKLPYLKHENLSLLLHSCQLDNNKEIHSKDVYFFPDVVQPLYPTVHV